MTAPNPFSTIAAAGSIVLAVIPSGSNYILNTALAAGVVVVGILDPTMTQRIFNPYTEALAPVSGDSASVWLPSLNTISAATVTDNLQSGSPTEIGQIKLNLKAGSKNTVEAASVMTFFLSPQALILLAATNQNF